jgi:methylase of polypeptide subunit release factors
LRPNGYIPKSGLLLAEYFLNNKQTYLKALEVGVGEIAFLPILLVKSDIVKNIDAIDIDPIAFKWSFKNIKENNLQKRIKLYNNFNRLPWHKYDLIYSNPPQLPVPVKTSLHDDGGIDGCDVISQIINYAEINLNKNGRLVLLLFDFLNVENSYNGKPTLIDCFINKGFDIKIKKRIFKNIRTGGKTEKNLNWIKKQYPLYDFKKTGRVGHQILILEAIKK